VSEVPTLEEQFRVLASCGVRLSAGATPEAVLAEHPREVFEKTPFRLLLAVLGGEEGWAANLWHFDTECIEDHGDYARIAERFRDLAGGELPLADIEDSVDLEAGEASVTFALDGKSYAWTCEVDDDWVDAAIISKFAEVFTARETGRRYTYLDLGGQDCVIGCLSDADRIKLSEATGLDIEWLE
jgi:hypothetical protein